MLSKAQVAVQNHFPILAWSTGRTMHGLLLILKFILMSISFWFIINRLDLEVDIERYRRRSERSGGILAKSETALKHTELLHIETDIVRLEIMRNLKNFVFMSKKII